ncbi:AmmeMemoRadiSam system protein B [Sediminispirochaeta smaragdinae]|uniref:AmmeMemoRadiSam system protein B n=1 Tax=Sediminispirochaeta smaragdinae (strain DSM 11293 / JCM 15392 / SEBR 4228) TaxID=573413 RepID=E1R1B7_SEDSS|nr:AmmeMemoRadiSam system protein B [Sediminispirochaeta smaragdinae]ADK81058.1 protein of unknown function DUF52 [Sediminispirochaeta smaragdinae DSM 11293]
MKGKKVRKRGLPVGWYPDVEREVLKRITDWEATDTESHLDKAFASIIPHAGWTFSGALAWKGIRLLNEDAESVIVVGGHLFAGSGILMALEDAFDTPLGLIPADIGFRDLLLEELSGKVSVREDTETDNSVEIHLPLIKYHFPKAKLIWLRVGSGDESLVLGECAARLAMDEGGATVMIGSTDLTHYGPDYHFMPAGTGGEAYRWVEANDAEMIETMVRMEESEVLRRGKEDRSACSSGAAAAVIRFARMIGAMKSERLAYYNSYKLYRAPSFVGYGSVAYGR